MTHCSTSIAREAAWTQAQDGENFVNAARARAEQIADLSAFFTFSRCNEQCFFTPDNTPVQLAMRVEPVQQPAPALTVIVRQYDGTWQWLVEGMDARCTVPAADIIACVQHRVGPRLVAHLTGPVN